MEVRDPIHGAIPLNEREVAVVDNRWVQRLRNIRQTGFSHLSFPGATHTRYAHCLGVMHLAGRAFDQAYSTWTFTDGDARSRFRDCVRLAALLHDLGHAPFSHCTEFAMPQLSSLGVSWLAPSTAGQPDRRAHHEDYTIAILELTDLVEVVSANFPCTTKHIAALISKDVRVDDGFFRDGGFDHRRLLSQIISSELDADRLDYLVRDAYYTGTQYGNVDVHWLMSSLCSHVADGQVWLAIESPALYAFEDFLIARHHMFLMVYFHHKSVVYEEMLRRWVGDVHTAWAIPNDLDEYLYFDDVALEYHLRSQSNRWAKRLVERRPFKRMAERHGSPGQVDLSDITDTLDAEGIEHIVASSTGRLSSYGQRRASRTPIYLLNRLPGQKTARVDRLVDASQIFYRYADARTITRVYVAPEDQERVRKLIP